MAPKKGAKRTQASQDAKASAPVEKKAKVVDKPKVASKFKPVVDAIEQAAHLSDSCRQMLITMVPCSLGTFADQRHEAQQVGVKLIGEALADVASIMQQAVEEQAAKLKEFEESYSELVVSSKAAEEALVAAAAAENEQKQALGEAARSVEAALAALQEKQDAQITGDAALDSAETHKAILTRALEVDLKPIAGGELEPAAAKTHYSALKPAIQLLTLEDSLTTALPASCVRPKDQRGVFDNMVLDQLEKTVIAKIEELARLLDEGAAAKRERAEAVQTASETVEGAKASQQSAAEQLTAMQEARKTASQEANVAKAKVGAYEPQRLDLAKARDAKIAELENFKQYNMCGFELVRDALSQPPAPPQATEANAADATTEAPAQEQGDVQPLKADASMTETAEAPVTTGGA